MGAFVRWFASLKMTIVLAILLAAALAGALYLHATHGLEWAQWYVFDTYWYTGLWGTLIANIAATTLARRPWCWRHPALVIVPVGCVVLAAGFFLTSLRGIDGRLILRKGETASSVPRTQRSQLTLLSKDGQDVQSVELGFSPGPADWPADESLDFGQVDGVGIKVLQFYRHARYQPEWVPDEAGVAEPAVQVAVSDSQGHGTKERWSVPVLFGNPSAPGEPDISIHQAFVPSLRDDFLQPPPVTQGTRGLLAVHYENRIYPILVDDNIGKKVSVGDSGLGVEIVEYYANAISKKGQFESRGTDPKNPMLLLRVYPPGQTQPISEIAYANAPFVNMASIKNQDCPADFWYHHPDATARFGAEFLQTPDGKLYCRVGDGGVFQPRGEVKVGDQIIVSADCRVTLLKYLPHARKGGICLPIDLAPGETTGAEAAALIELTTEEKSEQFWLVRNNTQLGVRKLVVPSGPLVVMFGYERSPLGFAVKLVDFQRDQQPHSTGDESCVSEVQLSEGAQDSEVPAESPVHEITAGSPLRYRGFTISQSGFQQLPGQVEVSELRVTSDPGRLLKYAGGAMICCGILYLLYLRATALRPTQPLGVSSAAE